MNEHEWLREENEQDAFRRALEVASADPAAEVDNTSLASATSSTVGNTSFGEGLSQLRRSDNIEDRRGYRSQRYAANLAVRDRAQEVMQSQLNREVVAALESMRSTLNPLAVPTGPAGQIDEPDDPVERFMSGYAPRFPDIQDVQEAPLQ